MTERSCPGYIRSAVSADGLHCEPEPGIRVAPRPDLPHMNLRVLASVATGRSDDFAAASIASDMSGYRSRIYVAHAADGLTWQRGPCLIEGAGYGRPGIDAVHAEDMSVIQIGDGHYRMYYAACDSQGAWRVASAVAHAA